MALDTNGKTAAAAGTVALASVITAVSGPLYMSQAGIEAHLMRLEQRIEAHVAVLGHTGALERIAAHDERLRQLDVTLQAEIKAADEQIHSSVKNLDEQLQREINDRIEHVKDVATSTREFAIQLREDIEILKRRLPSSSDSQQ